MSAQEPLLEPIREGLPEPFDERLQEPVEEGLGEPFAQPFPEPFEQPLPDRLVDGIAAAARYARSTVAPSTERAYRSDLADFERWCAATGSWGATPPVDSRLVATYLASLAEGDEDRAPLRPSSIARRAAAIAWAHRQAGVPSPTDDLVVQRVLTGIRRALGTAQRRATPLVTEQVRRMITGLDLGSATGLRDRALILVGFASALRRSELVGIDVQHLRDDEAGVFVEIPRSKTDQTGSGRTVLVTYGSHPLTCPVRSLGEWMQTAGITEGPVFRPVSKGGQVQPTRLSTRAVPLVLQRAAARVGIDATSISGHSLRAGHVTAADRGGARRTSIRLTTGHRSDATLDCQRSVGRAR